MGFFDSIGDAFEDVVGTVSDVFSGGKDSVSNIWNMGKSFLSGDESKLFSDMWPGLMDLGGNYLGNQLIGIPNAQMTYEQSKEASALAYERSKEATTLAYKRSQNEALRSFRRNQKMYKHRYEMTAQDMARAGLNPILAASSGFNVGSSPNAPMAQVFPAQVQQSSASSVHSPSISMTGSALSYAGADKASAETDLTIQNIQKSIADTARQNQEILESMERIFKTRADTKLATAQESETLQNIKNLEQKFLVHVSEVSRNVAEVRELASRSALQTAEQIQIGERIDQIRADVQLAESQNKKIRSETERLSDIADVYRGPIGPFLAHLEAVLASIGKLIGGIK